MRKNLLKLCITWLLFLLIFLGHNGLGKVYAETVSDGNAEENVLPYAVRVGIDTTTKGAWESVYGSDKAVLYGYQYVWNEESADSNGRILVNKDSKNVQVTKEDLPYTINHSYTFDTNLHCYYAEQDNNSVLDMPSGVQREKFKAYACSSALWTDTVYTLTFSDTDPHLISFYGYFTRNDGNMTLTIKDKNTGTVLLIDEVPAKTFKDGAYVTYLVSGSVTVTVHKPVAGTYAFSGTFFDTPIVNATYDLQMTGGTNRDVALSWEENEQITNDTKIIIERKDATNEIWAEIANINSGIKVYQDNDLTVGETYTYRLRTIAGTTYSTFGSEVSHTIGEPEPIEVVRIGMDTSTKGAWEGNYGNDVAILYGYKYSWTDETPVESSGRYQLAANSNDLIVTAEDLAYTVSHAYNCGGNLQCYAAEQSNTAILSMPSGVDRNKFNVIAASSNVKSNPSYTVSFNDNSKHLFSLYSNSGVTGNVVVTFKSTDGEVLLKDTITGSNFAGGAYVTYLVPSNFTMSYSREAAFSFSGSFFDTTIINETSDLTVGIGTKARSAKLAWNEEEALASNTKILIERKSETESAWITVATLDSGVKTYQDENLVAGESYTYRLRTKVGTSYSENGNSVMYQVPAYTITKLTLDNTNYTIKDTDQLLTVNVTLLTEDDIPCANQEITLTVDFEHSQQLVDSVITDTNGNAIFSFNPEYLGDAVLNVLFSDNDTDKLMNSSASATLFVGETSWTAAPVLWRISDGVLPDNLISINGYGLNADNMEDVVIYYAPHTSDVISNEPVSEAKILEKINTDPRDGFYVVTKLPADAAPGLYDIWVKNEYGFSNPMTINIARPLFINEYEAWAGQTITISGRNLQAAQFGYDSITKVRLTNGENSYEQEIMRLTPYSIKFMVGNIPLGEYYVEVTNNNGVSWSEIDSDQTLTVVEVGDDPLEVGVAWMDHFKWNNHFNVTAYGAVANDAVDDTDAFVAAMNAAKSSTENGGIVYIPDGVYYVSGLQIPANVVLLGESMEGTVLTYCGTGGNIMFEGRTEDKEIGHLGFARFSVRLANDSVRPDTFFWLGQEWDVANNAALRKASEFLMKEIDLEYPLTSGSNRGLGAVVIGNERFLMQDCKFYGKEANMTSIKLNRYSMYQRNTYTYETGCINSMAFYHFVEDSTILDQIREWDQTGTNHGFFGRQSVHMENNYVEGVGGYINNGEAFCVETPGTAKARGYVIDSSANSITVLTGYSELQASYSDFQYGRLVVRITGGRGMGQQVDVESIDAEKNIITIKEEWKVKPDSTSTFALMLPLDNVTFYNNTIKDTTKGVFLYGNIYDAVVANTVGYDTEGIYVHSAHVSSDDRDVQSIYITIRDNVFTGVGNETKDLKIGLNSQRQINGGNYYATGIYGIDIRNNILIGERGLTSTGITEGPNVGGLASWSAMKSGNRNQDGYCGDNMNVLWEDNYLTNFDVPITTTLGDYGYVYKGNRFENVGDISNTNTAGTDNHAWIDALSITPEILAGYVEVWDKVEIGEYSNESYTALQTALEAAKAVANNTDSTTDEIAAAMQNLQIAATSLKTVCEVESESIEVAGF